MSLQKNWGPYVLLKMSKTGLVFSQGGIAVDNMKNKNNLNGFKSNDKKVMGEPRRGQILTKY